MQVFFEALEILDVVQTLLSRPEEPASHIRPLQQSRGYESIQILLTDLEVQISFIHYVGLLRPISRHLQNSSGYLNIASFTVHFKLSPRYEVIFRNYVIKGYSNENGKRFPLIDKSMSFSPKPEKRVF